MKYKKTLYYSVRNGGDGSAYPRLMESAELASYDQESDPEGWGEDCSGYFIVESDSPIRIVSEVTTCLEVLINKLDDGHSDTDEFIAQFFPNGIPKFTVIRDESSLDKSKYAYFKVFADGDFGGKLFEEKNTDPKEIEKKLNSYGK
jgi:hypothetical protein